MGPPSMRCAPATFVQLPDARPRLVVATTHDCGLIGTATFAVVLAAAWGGRDVWPFVWRETEAMLGRTLLVVLPVIVAAASHLAGARARSGIELLAQGPQRSIARSRHRMAWELAAVVASALVLAAGVLGVTTGTASTYGLPQPLVLLPVIGWTTVGVVSGTLLGSRWPQRWVPIAAAVTSYAALVLLVHRAATPPLVAAHPLDDRSMTLYETAWWVYVVQAAVPVGLLLWSRGRTRWWGAVLVSLTLTTCFLAAHDERRPDPAAARVACSMHDRVTVCAPEVKQYLGPTIAESYSAVMAAAPFRAYAGDVLVDDEASWLDRSGPDGAVSPQDPDVMSMSELGLDVSAYSRPDRDALTGQWVQVLLQPSSESFDRRAQWVLERQVMRDLGLPTDGSLYPGAAPYDDLAPDARAEAAARQWSARSRSERRQWFMDHRTQWRHGTIVLADLQ